MRTLYKLAILPILAAFFVLVFSAAAYAQAAVLPSDTSVVDLLEPVYRAFAGGTYAYAASLLVIAMVALAKRYLTGTWPWLASDAGGALLALLAAGSGAMATALAVKGAVITLALVKSSVIVGVTAAGGYAVLKALVVDPFLRPLEAMAPTWLKPAFAILLWVFDKGPAAAQAEAQAKATAAAAAAVAASPAEGTAAVVGKPTDVK